MHVVQLHGILAARDHANRVALPFDVQLTINQASVDGWPAGATAAVLLAGGVDLAPTPSCEQLDELIEHAVSLADIGVITPEQFEQAMHEVIDAVCQWGAAAANN